MDQMDTQTQHEELEKSYQADHREDCDAGLIGLWNAAGLERRPTGAPPRPHEEAHIPTDVRRSEKKLSRCNNITVLMKSLTGLLWPSRWTDGRREAPPLSQLTWMQSEDGAARGFRPFVPVSDHVVGSTDAEYFTGYWRFTSLQRNHASSSL
ncbi:hypothetical protein EYF80_065605 [Liparis tanakae]|uniref:Uncharacterized protein n=1 Tax=Liparis tanakae TaxID=230148 RepID=A0A4Z2E7I1_9TELE|nr:hypothetical protein EYF80_065605 [Liparis tanakae]